MPASTLSVSSVDLCAHLCFAVYSFASRERIATASASRISPPPRSIGGVGVSFSGVMRYAQTGFRSGSISVMIAASCGETPRSPRVNSQYGSAIWNTPNRRQHRELRRSSAPSPMRRTQTARR